MKPVLIIQQVKFDTPDYFVDFLNQQKIPYELRCMHVGEVPPESIAGYSGYCMLGGPMSVNDEENFPFLRQQKALIREALELDIPVIGHCLGGQLMSVALGGTVSPATLPEIGWSALQIADDEQAREWFGGYSSVELFQWHNETFSVPYNARLIATNEHCRNQAFVIDDKHIGMQFHCEVNQEKVRYWAIKEKEDIDAVSHFPSVQSSQEIISTLEQRIPQSNALAHHIYSRWIRSLTD